MRTVIGCLVVGVVAYLAAKKGVENGIENSCIHVHIRRVVNGQLSEDVQETVTQPHISERTS